ncbi:MAG: hypothetical protein HRU00_09940 [Myxococcales bacterium]|nr:hypothetical protein [Myxococcales bacterium]
MSLGTDLESDIAAIDGGDDTTEAAGQWGDAMDDYAAGVVPVCSTVSAAIATLKGAMDTAFQNTVKATTVSALEAAFAAFGVTIGGGMAPAFTAVPPPGTVGFSGLMASDQSSQADMAEDWADAIDTWMKTGTATPSGGGSPINWS